MFPCYKLISPSTLSDLMFAPVDLPCVRLNVRDVITPIIFDEVYNSEAPGRFLPLASKLCPHGCKETHSDRQDFTRCCVTSPRTIPINNPQV